MAIAIIAILTITNVIPARTGVCTAAGSELLMRDADASVEDERSYALSSGWVIVRCIVEGEVALVDTIEAPLDRLFRLGVLIHCLQEVV
jgi:hypothetical protein